MTNVSEMESRLIEGGNPWALGAVAIGFFVWGLYGVYQASQKYLANVRGK